MKKSEQYYMAQMAVINSPMISPERKLMIIRTLMAAEDLALYTESREEEDNVQE